jgi:DNA-binding CsgD family transcriptional regulator
LIRGKSYQAIAENLGISRNTVAQHVQRIYKTLEINSRAELMAGTNQL